MCDSAIAGLRVGVVARVMYKHEFVQGVVL